MNVQEKLRKILVVNQIAEEGKWIPVDALGREADKDHYELVDKVACAKCGKTVKWNQKSWMQKHEAMHEQEEAKSKVRKTETKKRDEAHKSDDAPQVASKPVPTLSEVREMLWAALEKIEALAESEERERKQA